MEEKRFCPKCRKTRLVKVLQKDEELPVRDTPIRITSTVMVCPVCKEEFASTTQEEENVRKAYNEYRRIKCLLTPAEIKSIREAFELSQTNFSRWLGWGDITIHRYESGGLQDAAHNEALLFLRDPRNAQVLVEKHRSNLDEATAERLQKRIAVLLNTTVGQLIESDLVMSLAMTAPSEFNGYRRFDIDRFENLVLYVLESVGKTFKTGMNKFLWYVDFGYFREQNQSITGCQYLRFPHGPIPKSYDFLFASMLEKGLLEVEEVITKDYSGERYSAKAHANTDLFQGNELKLIDAIVDVLKGRSSKQLSDLAHEETAYVLTKDRQSISYRHASDLKLKLAAVKAK